MDVLCRRRVFQMILLYLIVGLHYHPSKGQQQHHPSTLTRNRYFDKSIQDEETLMLEDELMARSRERRQHHPFSVDLERLLSLPEDAEEMLFVDDSVMYRPDRFEGDIVNPGMNSRILKSFGPNEGNNSTHTPGVQRNAVRNPYMKWPNGRIPFTVSKQYNTFGRQRIAQALNEYHRRTCVRFVPKALEDIDYVHILPDDGCYSLVGRVGGKQPVSLGEGCIIKGIIIHELMHAVGFFHEQSRTDRDDFVTINWENVENGLQDQFDKYPLSMIDYLGTSYDYASIMHYGPTAFSKNGLPTMEPKQKGIRIGQRIDFSPVDLFKVNRLYLCPNTPKNPQLEATTDVPNTAGAVTINAGGTVLSVVSGGSGSGEQQSWCSDQRSDCPSLANNGLCTTFYSAGFMSLHCPRTCNHCRPLSEAKRCQDAQPWCLRWVQLCQLPIDLIHRSCMRSCGLCPPPSTPPS